MASFIDIAQRNKAVHTPELNWLFEDWAGALYGNAIVKAFNNIRGEVPANFYCVFCNRLYSAKEAFEAVVKYEVVFPEQRQPQPIADKELAAKLENAARSHLAGKKLEAEGWKMEPESFQVGGGEKTAAFTAAYTRGTEKLPERLYLLGEVSESSCNIIRSWTEEGELVVPRLVKENDGTATVYSFKIAGRTPREKNENKNEEKPQANLRCKEPECREAPLENFRLGTDQTFNPNPKAEEKVDNDKSVDKFKFTAFDKYMLALPEPPIGHDGQTIFEKPHEYVTEDYLNALLLEDEANKTMRYMEGIGQAERLEIPNSCFPRGWRMTREAAHACRKKSQWLHDRGVRTVYLQFLRWRERGADELKYIIEDVKTRVREPRRIATARRIADFPALTSKPDIGENPPESYLAVYPLEVSMQTHKISINLKHVPNIQLTSKSKAQDRLKRQAWEFLWLHGKQV